MDVTLSPAQSAVLRRYAELVSDELIPSIRRMAEAPRGGDDDPGELAQVRGAVWQALVDLGATRALLPEPYRAGERFGQQEAVTVAELLGTALYQGPLFDTMTAGELLSRAGEPDGKLLERIAEGAAVALAPRESAADTHALPGPITLSGRPADEQHGERDRDAGAGGSKGPVTVGARRRFVSFAADADYLLLLGRPDAAAQTIFALVPRDTTAVSLRRHEDVARGELYDVRVDGATAVAVHAEPAANLAGAWRRVLAHARIRHAAYLIGLSQGALSLAVGRAGERRQFGQSIGRFQAPAFDLARIAAELEAARWLVYAAAWEADDGADARLSAAQALALAADLARTATAAAMQIHGAYGSTEQADIQLYYRRACVDRVWLGTPAELRREVLPLLLASRAHRREPAPEPGP